MEKKLLKIEYLKIEELIPYTNNPRKSENSVDLVASSIKNFGFKVPIIIDKQKKIIAGHTRLLAAKKLKIDYVPVIVADDLNENQIKAFRLADNKVAEFSKWDDELLWSEISQIDGLEMKDFGFEILNVNDFDESFKLPDGEKEPFQQMTFTLSDEQAEEIKKLLLIAKKGNKWAGFDNENKNGNALYRVFKEWEELKKL